MKTRTLLIFLLTSMLSTGLKAQSVCRQVLINYPPSVITKVYEVVTKIPLSDERQMKLAAFYQQEDSLITSAMLQGKSPHDVTALQLLSGPKFQSLFTPEELDRYYTILVYNEAWQKAKAIASVFEKDVNGDTLYEHNIFASQLNKFIEMGKVQLQYKYDPSLSKHLASIAEKYDTLYNRVTEAHWCNLYFKTQVAKLDSVKLISTADKDDLWKIYARLCYYRPRCGYALNFNTALPAVLTDTVYSSAIYRYDINYKALLNAQKQYAGYVKEYRITKDCGDKLYPVLCEKEKKLITIDYAIPGITKQKEKMQDRVSAKYDSIVTMILYKDGSNTPNSKFFAAVKQRKLLGLTQTQVDTLLIWGFELQKLKDEARNQNITFNARKYERENLVRILSQEQYEKLYVTLNRENAHNWAVKDWDDLKKNNLMLISDSAKTFRQIENYELSRCIVIDRYNDDKELKGINLKAIDETMPVTMRSLKAYRRQIAKAGTADQKEKQYRGDFQW